MKHAKALFLILFILACCSAALTACNGNVSSTQASSEGKLEYAAIDDIPAVNGGIALRKQDAQIKETVDEVIGEWRTMSNVKTNSVLTTMEHYMAYLENVYVYGTGAVLPPSNISMEWDLNINATPENTIYCHIWLPSSAEGTGTAPFGFVGNRGEVFSLDIFIMSEVAQRLNMNLEIVLPEFKADGTPKSTYSDVFQFVKDSRYPAVGIGGLAITDQHNDKVSFSRPYCTMYLGLFSYDGYDNIFDLEGKTVAVQAGSRSEEILSAAVSSSGLRGCGPGGNLVYKVRNLTVLSLEKGGEAEGFYAVKRGDADAVLAPYLSGKILLRTTGI